jgi:KipI family sensor histidine kinase inhibitor
MTASIEPLGDCALLIQFGERIDVQLNAQAIALAAALRAAQLPGVLDIAPAYGSVCVRYAPAQADARERLAAAIRPLLETAAPAPAASAAPVEIPVCYGGEFGPDLDAVAQQAQLETSEVIARHAGADYRVAMLGFAPGFPYLLGLPAALHTPRRDSPRTRVPAGAVAIGGAQTGIYPRELPGGWNIVGRTPLRLFDLDRDPPALLAPGTRVRLRAIDIDEFAALTR